MKTYHSLVLNIPHASTYIPKELMPETTWLRHVDNDTYRQLFPDATTSVTRQTAYALYEQGSRPLIDYYTDELFALNDNPRITPIVADICRTLCDVERMTNDPLEAEGYGVVYRRILSVILPHGAGGPKVTFKHVFYNPICERLLQYYIDYQHRLASAIIHSAFQHRPTHYTEHIYTSINRVLLVDCHSFSSSPTALCDPGPSEEQVDICIGYNDDSTRPDDEIIDFVVAYFERLGYRVGRNRPFSHSKTVACPITYHSLMIEVNKRCYMNEQTLEKNEGFVPLQEAIRGLYRKLLTSASIYLK